MTLCVHYALNRAGGRVVHSYGRLIPHEFPITNLQQISGPDGIGRITCTVSSGTARFIANGGQLETGGVTQTRNGATATLVVKPSNVGSFQNRGLYCTNPATNFFYLFISSASKYTLLKLQPGKHNFKCEFVCMHACMCVCVCVCVCTCVCVRQCTSFWPTVSYTVTFLQFS